MGKIMMNGIQYGVGGITDADDVKYTDSQTVKGALDEVKNGLTNILTGSNVITTSHTISNAYASKVGNIVVANATLVTTSSVSAWSTMAVLFTTLRTNAYGYAIVDNVIVPIFITAGGNIQPVSNVASGKTVVLTIISLSN